MTIADFSVWSTLLSLRLLVPIDSEKFPKLTSYLMMLQAHPGFEVNREGAERQASYVLKCLAGMEYNGKIAVEIFRESKNYQHIIHEWDDINIKNVELKEDEHWVLFYWAKIKCKKALIFEFNLRLKIEKLLPLTVSECDATLSWAPLTWAFVLVVFPDVKILFALEGTYADATISIELPVVVSLLIDFAGVALELWLLTNWIALKVLKGF